MRVSVGWTLSNITTESFNLIQRDQKGPDRDLPENGPPFGKIWQQYNLTDQDDHLLKQRRQEIFCGQKRRPPKKHPQKNTSKKEDTPFHWNRRHVIDSSRLAIPEVEEVMKTAESFAKILQRPVKKVPTLQGKVVVNMFYENSTRTLTSFELASKYLSAETVNFSVATSSAKKGESLIDTAETLLAMGTDAVVIRHSHSGICHQLKDYFGNRICVLNAGDGYHDHPSQGLLDMYSLMQRMPNGLAELKDKKIVIVGDIQHSRVARSNIHLLNLMGADVHVVAPATLLPVAIEQMGVTAHTNIETALQDADVVMCLRMQMERQRAGLIPPIGEYTKLYCITQERLKKFCKPDVLVMHPGPMNRGIEIASEVADNKENSLITNQVTSGVAIRMALLYLVLSTPEDLAGGHVNEKLLKGGRVITPTGKTDKKGRPEFLDDTLDVLIEDGEIRAIEKNIAESDADEVVQINPKHWVVPGLIDIHVHFRDPGQSAKETTATGAAAAIAGGFTTVCIMPNTTPAIDNLPTLQYTMQVAEATGIRIIPIPGVTKGLKGEELTAMGSMLKHGAVGFTDDGYPIENANIMRKALEYAKMFGAPIVCHAETTALCGCGVMHEGYYSSLLGLPGIPSVAESTMIARDIVLARDTGGHVHFAHLSCKESVELIREAKKEGLKITADTTPHNLTLTDAEIVTYNPNFKMYGPLRSEEDRQALEEGIKDGTIDAIATDHAPHTPEEKALTFDAAPRGVIGLETSLSVIMTNFYHNKKLTEKEVIYLMTLGGAQAMNLKDCGTLAIGKPADITVIDPEQEWVVDPLKFQSKSRNTPFAGMTLKGKAVKVYASGNLLLEEETVYPSVESNKRSVKKKTEQAQQATGT